jgi:hypothetical protein
MDNSFLKESQKHNDINQNISLLDSVIKFHGASELDLENLTPELEQSMRIVNILKIVALVFILALTFFFGFLPLMW